MGFRNIFINGIIYNSVYGIGVYWDLGSVYGGFIFNIYFIWDCMISIGIFNMIRIVMV